MQTFALSSPAYLDKNSIQLPQLPVVIEHNSVGGFYAHGVSLLDHHYSFATAGKWIVPHYCVPDFVRGPWG
jgi:hypothetical protein